MVVTIDQDTQAITNFYLWSNSESTSNGKVTNSEWIELTGKEGLSIPLFYSDAEYGSHQVSGTDMCNAIDEFKWVHSLYTEEPYEVTNTLMSYSCLNNASLTFSGPGILRIFTKINDGCSFTDLNFTLGV